MRYGLYTPIKKMLGVDPATPKHEIPMMKRILSGAAAGALASAICNPTDLIKVRRARHSTPPPPPPPPPPPFRYPTCSIGPFVVWRSSASALYAFPCSVSRELPPRVIPDEQVRMMADGMKSTGTGPRYTGLFNAFTQIVQKEGVLGLWKGVGPTCGRATVLAAAELATYDEVRG